MAGENIGLLSFIPQVEDAIRRSLVAGVEVDPYGDEMFVDRKSMFFIEGHDKAAPDVEKYALLQSIDYHGGKEWRKLWEKAAPALEAARRLTIPVARVWSRPDGGELNFPHLFCARAGDDGGIYLGLQNKSDSLQKVDLVLMGTRFGAEIEPGKVYAWWWDKKNQESGSLMF